MFQIFGIACATVSTVTGLAMLLLIVWQAPRHRTNQLMAAYLLTLIYWGGTNLAARLSAVLGHNPAVFVYGNVLAVGLNNIALFAFVTHYAGIAARWWARALLIVAGMWLVVSVPAIFRGERMTNVMLSPDGLVTFRVSPWGIPGSVASLATLITALVCLWAYRHGRVGRLLPGGIVLVVGVVLALAVWTIGYGVPPFPMAAAAIASVWFTYVIMRESLFNPLARSEASLTALVETTVDPVWSIDAAYQLVTYNSAFANLVARLSGTRPRRGLHAVELLPPRERPLWQPLYERALQGERVAAQRHVNSLGDTAHLDVTFNPIVGPEGEPVGVAVFARDVTVHVRALDEQARARDVAEVASRTKSQFLANVSHELRTPLNAIIGFSQILARQRYGELNTKQMEFADTILTAGQHLRGLIDDVIDLTKIESSKPELAVDSFTLSAEITAAVRLLAASADQKGLELVIDVGDDVPDQVIGDARRVRQVLVNLVGNAVKFTERGHVSVDVSREHDDPSTLRLRFDVSDTGIGLPVGREQDMFEPFVQAEASPREGGSGLGLTISRRLVEAMGGQLTAESEPGRGATFSFVLPFAEPADAVPMAPVVDFGGASVLVVVNRPALRTRLERWLPAWGLRPAFFRDVATASAALTRARNAGESFRALLIDDALADATDLVARVRDERKFVGATIVLQSPLGNQEVAAGLTYEAVSVRRPFTPAELRNALAVAIDARHEA